MFNFSGLGNNPNPLLPPGTGGTSTGNIFLGTNLTNPGLPNPLTGTGGTSTLLTNPLTGIGGTSTPVGNNPLNGALNLAAIQNPNQNPPFTSNLVIPPSSIGLGGTTTNTPLTNNPPNGTPQNLAAIQNQSQNSSFASNFVLPPSGLGGTTGTGLGGTTNLFGGGPSLTSPLGLSGGTSSSSGGLSQVLTVLVQLLTQLGPTLNAAKPPVVTPTPPKGEEENPEIKKLNDRIDELEKENKELRQKIEDKKNEEPPAPPPETGGNNGGNNTNTGNNDQNTPSIKDLINSAGGNNGAYINRIRQTLYNDTSGDWSRGISTQDLNLYLAKSSGADHDLTQALVDLYGDKDNPNHRIGVKELNDLQQVSTSSPPPPVPGTTTTNPEPKPPNPSDNVKDKLKGIDSGEAFINAARGGLQYGGGATEGISKGDLKAWIASGVGDPYKSAAQAIIDFLDDKGDDFRLKLQDIDNLKLNGALYEDSGL